MKENPSNPVKKKTFGTLAGVFTPTTLTILGVIMFIRQPWVVGNAGLAGAILIVLLAVVITASTALSLSSITTNVRIGSGGAFSLIAQSLGLEIGGAIGIPFYFAQAVAVAMYIFGFREGLQTFLPEISPLLLDGGIFLLVMAIAFISTGFAFKIQYLILLIIAGALVSIYGGLFTHELHTDFQWLGTYPGSPDKHNGGSSFWVVFAVFFPAVTGVMAGANMSGDLSDPRKSIPNGTLSAVLLTTLIYISLCFVAALLAPTAELVGNYNVFIDYAWWPPLVLAGLLGATFSSAIGSFVGAPRILLALGEKHILPKSDFLAKTTRKGEPHNAMMITAVIVVFGLAMRNLNTIAPLITMFFMITYAMVNVVALVEQSLGLPSFRPTLRIPILIPVIGALGSVTIMFIINAFVALASLILILVFYYYLVGKNIKSEAGDSRSGLFTALAEWATKKTNQLSPKREVRSWRPDLLIPVSRPKDVRSSFKLIRSLIYPKGSVKMLVFKAETDQEEAYLSKFVKNVEHKFEEIKVPVSYSKVKGSNFNDTLNVGMQALKAAFFRPNTVFISLDPEETDQGRFKQLILDARNNQYGVVVYAPFGTASLAMEEKISLWITDLPENWQQTFNIGNNDLAILFSILIAQNWGGQIEVNVIAKSNEIENIPEGKALEDYFSSLKEIVRFPKETTIQRIDDPLESAIYSANADLNIFSISDLEFGPEAMIRQVYQAKVSAIYCYDSGLENALV